MRNASLAAPLVALALLLAGCSGSSEARYPESYVLEADELPDGLRLSEVPPDFPMDNPGRVPAFAHAMLVEEFGEVSPDEVWAELIEPVTGDGGMLIASGFWTDASKAAAAVQAIKGQSDGEMCNATGDVSQVYLDGQVVLVIGGDQEMRPWVDDVLRQLRNDAPGLVDAC